MVYWTSPCIDHIPKVFFSVPFFSKELSHKNNCPVRNEILRVFFSENHNFHIWGVSRKLVTFEKITVTGMNLRDLNVLLLHYPFMSNPRYYLGCATQKIDLHSFIFLQLLFLCPVHNPFLPILRQPAGKVQLSPFSTKKCIPHVSRRKYYSVDVSREQNDFTIHT